MLKLASDHVAGPARRSDYTRQQCRGDEREAHLGS